MTLPNYPPKGNGSYIQAFLLRSSGHSLTVCGSNLQCDHSSNYCWNSDISLLIKGKLRANCQQWQILGMDNVLQTWFHLLLPISAVCTIWLHFWVDKNTEHKTGSNHICVLPAMNIFSIANGIRQPHTLVYQAHSSNVDSQPDTSPQHTTPHIAFAPRSWPGPPSILHIPRSIWAPLGFKIYNWYDNFGLQF